MQNMKFALATTFSMSWEFYNKEQNEEENGNGYHKNTHKENF